MSGPKLIGPLFPINPVAAARELEAEKLNLLREFGAKAVESTNTAVEANREKRDALIRTISDDVMRRSLLKE